VKERQRGEVAIWVRIHQKKKKIDFFLLFISVLDDFLVGFVWIFYNLFGGFCMGF
jgi:hypothetical protein